MKNLAIVTLWVGITILTAPATIAADLALKAGLNLVSLTKVPASGLTSYGLLDVFGPNLLAVSRINASLQHVETTTFQDGAAGAEFPMSIDQAYFVEMAAESDIELRYTGEYYGGFGTRGEFDWFKPCLTKFSCLRSS